MPRCLWTLSVLVAIGAIAPLHAQLLYEYDVPSRTVFYDPAIGSGTFSLAPTIAELPDNPFFPNAVFGFAMALGADSDIVLVTDLQPSEEVIVAVGEPEFFAAGLFGEAWTVGVFFDFTGNESMIFPTATPVIDASYDYGGLQGNDTGLTVTFSFVDGLGDPPVENLIVTGAELNDVVPCDGTVLFYPGPPPFFFEAADQTVVYDFFTGEGSFSEPLSIFENPDNLGFPTITLGLAMGLGHDPELLQATAVTLADEFLDLFDDGPDFFAPAIEDDGITAGVVYSFLGFAGLVVIVFEEPVVVLEVAYDTVPFGLAGEAGAVTVLAWTDELGDPMVENVVATGVGTLPAGFIDGVVELVALLDPQWIRGDCNDDGGVDVADGIFLLNALFQGGAEPGCLAACDADGDGIVGVPDAVFVFEYQLLGGAPPAAPFPSCGEVPGVDCGEALACLP